MTIPNQFQLLGQTIQVNFGYPEIDNKKVLGTCDPTFNKIELASEYGGTPIPRDKYEQVYVHEVMHMILHYMGEDKLYENEHFVESLSLLVHQWLETSKL